MTKEIQLTQGKVALVDDEDFEYLNQWKWCVAQRGYATRAGIGRIPITMHKQIMKTPKGKQCDHINGNRLDNRKANLRICLPSENTVNRKKYSTNTSGYKGVSLQGGKWHAKIGHKFKQYHLGFFETKEDAAKAYDAAAKEKHGKFAKLNFPD